MGARVTYWSFPGTPQQRTDELHRADEVLTTPAGDLEVREEGKVVKAYAAGHWVEGWMV